jgi:hypothetical protein
MSAPHDHVPAVMPEQEIGLHNPPSLEEGRRSIDFWRSKTTLDNFTQHFFFRVIMTIARGYGGNRSERISNEFKRAKLDETIDSSIVFSRILGILAEPSI